MKLNIETYYGGQKRNYKSVRIDIPEEVADYFTALLTRSDLEGIEVDGCSRQAIRISVSTADGQF